MYSHPYPFPFPLFLFSDCRLSTVDCRPSTFQRLSDPPLPRLAVAAHGLGLRHGR
jgi:hypothetical protein